MNDSTYQWLVQKITADTPAALTSALDGLREAVSRQHRPPTVGGHGGGSEMLAMAFGLSLPEDADRGRLLELIGFVEAALAGGEPLPESEFDSSTRHLGFGKEESNELDFGFSPMKYDEQTQSIVGSFRFKDRDVALVLVAESEADFEVVLSHVEEAYARLPAIATKATDYVVSSMLRNKNEGYLAEAEMIISATGLRSAITLESVTIASGGTSFDFDDGDMFGGHRILADYDILRDEPLDCQVYG